jgi:hypothetical protein
VVVTTHGELFRPPDEGCEQFSHAHLDGSGIGPAVAILQLGTPAFLIGRHATLSPQHAIGVIEHVSRVDLYRYVVMKRKILAAFKALESIDGHIAMYREAREGLSLE